MSDKIRLLVRDFDDALRRLNDDIENQLKDGRLVAKGMLEPITPETREQAISVEWWRFLMLIFDSDKAFGNGVRIVGLMIGRPV